MANNVPTDVPPVAQGDLGYPASLPQNVSQPQPSVSPTGVPFAQASDPAYQLSSNISPSDQPGTPTLPSSGSSPNPTSPDMSSGPMPGVLGSGSYNQAANRGGVVKNALTRMFYGMGQAAMAHVGLPTDYDIQRTAFQQRIQANELALKQQAQAWQQTMVPYTLANGNTVYMTPAMAAKVLPVDVSGGYRLGAAQVNKELMVTPQGLYRTGLFSGQQPGLVPGTERGTIVDDALIAEYPQLGPLRGQFLKTPELMRAYGQGLQTVPTTSTTYDPILQTTTVTHKYKNIPGNLPGAAAPAATPAVPTTGGLPEIPQPVQSPLLPSGPLTQVESDRLKQFGINAPAGTQPVTVPPQTPAAPAPSAVAPTVVPPAVTNRVPQGSPAARAFAGAPAGPQGATTTPTAPTVGGPAAGAAIPPAPPGVPTSIWQAGVKLATGYGNPNVASRSKYGTAILDAADTYSRQTTGKPYDQAQDVINFNYANQTTTQNTLKFLNSLTGGDNKSGNLQTLINMSDSPALARTQWPAINDVQAWTRLQSGSGPQAAYAALALETADQVGKILAGGQAGTSDKKLGDAQALFQKGFNTEQMRDTATALRTALANRKNEMIANNPYLQRQYGQPSASQAPGANWGAQFGAKPK